jgi:hypothetical protein
MYGDKFASLQHGKGSEAVGVNDDPQTMNLYNTLFAIWNSVLPDNWKSVLPGHSKIPDAKDFNFFLMYYGSVATLSEDDMSSPDGVNGFRCELKKIYEGFNNALKVYIEHYKKDFDNNKITKNIKNF